MCLQFSVDNYHLQAQGWALTEYGDGLQSLVTTRLENQFIQCTFFRERTLVPKEVFITLHYIT